MCRGTHEQVELCLEKLLDFFRNNLEKRVHLGEKIIHELGKRRGEVEAGPFWKAPSLQVLDPRHVPPVVMYARHFQAWILFGGDLVEIGLAKFPEKKKLAAGIDTPLNHAANKIVVLISNVFSCTLWASLHLFGFSNGSWNIRSKYAWLQRHFGKGAFDAHFFTFGARKVARTLDLQLAASVARS